MGSFVVHIEKIMIRRIITIFALTGFAVLNVAYASESLTAKTARLEKELHDMQEMLGASMHHAVLSSPYIGLNNKYDGSDLASKFPSINEDLHLLQQKQSFHVFYNQSKRALPKQPLIELSGKLEAIAFEHEPFGDNSDHGIDFNTAELAVITHAHRWVSGFFALTYDNSPSFLNRNRAANSRFYLNKGFITYGDLSEKPYYVTVGQMNLPFGRYSSGMISASLPSQLGRTRVRAINLGYYDVTGHFGQFYFYNGNMATHELNYGVNLGLDKQLRKNIFLNVAAGVLSDIADSDGMQNNGNPVLSVSAPSVFSGFGLHSATGVDRLEHSVPAANIHTRLRVGVWNFIGEYTHATRRFDPNDLLMNTHGAKPSALQLELVRNLKIQDKTANVALGYQSTKDALALNMPEQRYAVVLSTSLFRNTIQAIEFRHDKIYGRSDTASGRAFSSDNLPNSGVSVLNAALNVATSSRISNLIVLQTGLYF